MLDRYIEDTERLVSALPYDSPIASRADYLIGKLMDGCFEVNPDVFSRQSFAVPVGTKLLVTRKDLLELGTSKLSEMARQTKGTAFIAHGVDVPSVIVLPIHDPGAPIGNGHVLLHEVEHFTEPEDGIPIESKAMGKKERRAYRTNRHIMESLDGSDFERYISAWPVSFTTHQRGALLTADLRFHDEDCPEPPLQTFAHELWTEGTQSQQLLQSVGRMTVLESVASEFHEVLIDQLAGNLQLTGEEIVPDS